MSKPPYKSDLIDLEVELERETEKAWLVDYDGNEFWVPKSQCELEDGTLTIPEWLAKEKGMI